VNFIIEFDDTVCLPINCAVLQPIAAEMGSTKQNNWSKFLYKLYSETPKDCQSIFLTINQVLQICIAGDPRQPHRHKNTHHITPSFFGWQLVCEQKLHLHSFIIAVSSFIPTFWLGANLGVDTV
jgi:hypothetical protein